MIVALVPTPGPLATAGEKEIFVDGAKGKDGAASTESAPLRIIHEAIAKVPNRVTENEAIHLAPGCNPVTGGAGEEAGRLLLDRATRHGKRVRIIGGTAGFTRAAPPGTVILDWPKGPEVPQTFLSPPETF